MGFLGFLYDSMNIRSNTKTFLLRRSSVHKSALLRTERLRSDPLPLWMYAWQAVPSGGESVDIHPPSFLRLWRRHPSLP